MMKPKNRPPIRPGEILKTEFLEPNRISQAELARALRPLPPTTAEVGISQIITGVRGIGPVWAKRLSHVFGNSPAFWLNLQKAWNAYCMNKELHELELELPKETRGIFAKRGSK